MLEIMLIIGVASIVLGIILAGRFTEPMHRISKSMKIFRTVCTRAVMVMIIRRQMKFQRSSMQIRCVQLMIQDEFVSTSPMN